MKYTNVISKKQLLLVLLFGLLFLNETKSQSISATTIRIDSIYSASTTPARPLNNKAVLFSRGILGWYIIFSNNSVVRIDSANSFRYQVTGGGSTWATDSLRFVEGTSVTITRSGNAVTINSSAGGSGGSPKMWYRINNSSTDSSSVFRVPSGVTTIDSVVFFKTGAVATTVNLRKISNAGAAAALLSSDYTVTTAWVAAGGLYQNSVSQNDVIWVRVVTTGGIVPYVACAIYFR